MCLKSPYPISNSKLGTYPTQPGQGYSQQSNQPCGQQSYGGYSQSGDTQAVARAPMVLMDRPRTAMALSQLRRIELNCWLWRWPEFSVILWAAVLSWLSVARGPLLAAPREDTVAVLRAATTGSPNGGCGPQSDYGGQQQSSRSPPQGNGQQNRNNSSSGGSRWGGGGYCDQDQSPVSGGSSGGGYGNQDQSGCGDWGCRGSQQDRGE